jgi:hypothetical protein
VSFLRALLGDLVEKRLWPIALLLAMTAVAVPLVLGRGGTGAAGAPVAAQPAAAGDAAALSAPAVEIVGPGSVRSRSGNERDPLRRATKAPAATATADGAAAKLRARVYHGGRDVLREMIKDAQTAAAIGRFGFDRSLGAVVATNAP